MCAECKFFSFFPPPGLSLVTWEPSTGMSTLENWQAFSLRRKIIILLYKIKMKLQKLLQQRKHPHSRPLHSVPSAMLFSQMPTHLSPPLLKFLLRYHHSQTNHFLFTFSFYFFILHAVYLIINCLSFQEYMFYKGSYFCPFYLLIVHFSSSYNSV